MALYEDPRSNVPAAGGTSEPFEITVEVHQSSVLSSLLFNLAMEEATKECRRGVPWDMLYDVDLVLSADKGGGFGALQRMEECHGN